MSQHNVPQDDIPGTSNFRNKWRDVLDSLQVQMRDSTSYRAYLADSQATFDRDANALTVAVRNGFVKEWVRCRIAGRLRRTVAQVYGDDVDVHLTTSDHAHHDALRGSGLELDHWAWSDAEYARYQRGLARELERRYPLRRGMTLDEFVASDSNQRAVDACRSVIENPGIRYNPLTITADTGLGKSHLCYAAAHALRKRGYAVIILTAQRFKTEYVDATRASKVPELSQRYRAADALIIDGIEKLLSGPGTQTFLLDLLEHHLSQNNQVIVAANAGYAIQDLAPELVSRLAGGLELNIDQPDERLKRRVLEHYAAQRNLNLLPEAIVALASAFVSDVRQLIGGVQRIAASVKPTPDAEPGTPVVVSRAAAMDAARDRLTVPAPHLAAPEQVLAAVSQAFAISEDALTQSGRGNTAITTARDALSYLLRERCGMTSDATGVLLGGRSHSTILDAIRRHEQRRADDPALLQTEQEASRLVDSLRSRRSPKRVSPGRPD